MLARVLKGSSQVQNPSNSIRGWQWGRSQNRHSRPLIPLLACWLSQDSRLNWVRVTLAHQRDGFQGIAQTKSTTYVMCGSAAVVGVSQNEPHPTKPQLYPLCSWVYTDQPLP